ISIIMKLIFCFNKQHYSLFLQCSYFLSIIVIMAMFASQGSYLLENLEIIYILIIPILMFFVINYVIGRLVGKFLKFTYEDSVSLSMTIIARNSPVSLAIAVRA